MNTTILAVVIVEAAAILGGALKLSFSFGRLTAKIDALCNRVSRLERVENCDESIGGTD